jgi:RsiW-degrading membrane proteinase PrsW (M82 family)
MSGPPHPPISTQQALGATISTAYVGCQMRAFAIVEHEVRTISMMNTLGTIFFSVGTTCLGFAVGIWTNAMFYDTLTPEGRILSHVIAPFLCGLAFVLGCLGVWAFRSRSTTWDAIRRESLPET